MTDNFRTFYDLKVLLRFVSFQNLVSNFWLRGLVGWPAGMRTWILAELIVLEHGYLRPVTMFSRLNIRDYAELYTFPLSAVRYLAAWIACVNLALIVFVALYFIFMILMIIFPLR